MSSIAEMFQNQKYVVFNDVISHEVASLMTDYLFVKKEAGLLVPPVSLGGDDQQCPLSWSIYGDPLFDTLLARLAPKLSDMIGVQLIPAYTYSRIYQNGEELKYHKDRPSCEISTTMNLGGDEWPIYLEAKKNVGLPEDGFPSKTDNKGTKVILKPGDMLVYKGMILEHWREAFIGQDCAQVFLHYNNSFSPGADDNMFDQRPHLGLPAWFKGRKINS